MSERVTIMLNSKLASKLRSKQAKEIQDTQKSVSFSKVVNDILMEGFKNVKG